MRTSMTLFSIQCQAGSRQCVFLSNWFQCIAGSSLSYIYICFKKRIVPIPVLCSVNFAGAEESQLRLQANGVSLNRCNDGQLRWKEDSSMTSESDEKVAKEDMGRRNLHWVAKNASKRHGEWFLMICSGVTLFWLLGVIVPFQLYEYFTSFEYLVVGILAVLPLWTIPIIYVPPADRQVPLWSRYSVKAQVGWIGQEESGWG